MTVPPDNMSALNWAGFSASIPGGGHIRHGIPCQDASAVITSSRPAAIVCDGRGSAKLSHFGARGTVDAFRSQISILEPFLANILDAEEKNIEQWTKFCRIIYRTLMQVKYDLAEKHNENEKEFDCTVAFAIAGKKHIGCFQVGDGAIVLRQNGTCKTVFPPEKGEYANQTHFPRTGGEVEMKFQHALLDAEANSGIAITSDGPEHLMFRLNDMTPGKIFDNLMDDLLGGDLCQQDLMDYLTRPIWANDPRGADDRSLAVLARTQNASRIMPENKTETIQNIEEENSFEEENSVAEAPVAADVRANASCDRKFLYPILIAGIILAAAFGTGAICLLKQNLAIDALQNDVKFLNQQIEYYKKQQEKSLSHKPSIAAEKKTVPPPQKEINCGNEEKKDVSVQSTVVEKKINANETDNE